MNEVNLNLTSKEILNKDFKFDAKGYRPKEVDEFLDLVIQDYETFKRYTRRIENDNKNLEIENSHLKNEIRKLQMLLETQEETKSNGKFSSNNVDLLKRLSNLEKVVYGKNE